MEIKPEIKPIELAYQQKAPLVFLRDTETLIRQKTVANLLPILPEKLATNLQEISQIADESLQELAQIDLDTITQEELRYPRIAIGLTFVGFSALLILFLLMYIHTLHPEFNLREIMQNYWYEYIFFLCFGVTGMFLLGRESMRK
ncbi:MAG TPA: hypothetical protein V6C58_00460 [Allocoleopsis sp.]